MKTTVILTLLCGIAFGAVSTSPAPGHAAMAATAASAEEPQGELIVSSFLLVCESDVTEKHRACGNSNVAGPFATPTTAREYREEFGLKCEIKGQSTDEPTYCWDDWLKKKGDEWVRY